MARWLFRAVLALWLSAVPAFASANDRPLIPRTVFDGPALTFDFPGLRIGIAEYDEGPTGTTVFYFPEKVMAVVDVRGGAPGTIFTDALRLGNSARRWDGIVFAGGSSYGLAAASGAAAALKPQRVSDGQWQEAATFAGAIIYDINSRRLSTVTPDEALGKAALAAAVEGRFPLGPRGAGRSAMQGYYFANKSEDWPHSGQGGAFRQIGTTKIAVFTVVNAIGAVVDRQGRVVRCSYAPSTKDCGSIGSALERRLPQLVSGAEGDLQDEPAALSSNTTVTLVVTNQKLGVRELQRLAVQVHGSMARGIQPYSTMDDGDVLFAVSTAEVDNPGLSAMDLSTIASEVAWDAILASVPPLDAPYSKQPVELSPDALDAFAGTYEFQSGARVAVKRDGAKLFTTLTGMGGLFFAKEGNHLISVGQRDFLIDGARGDLIRFDEDRLTVNPGQWPQVAKRIR